jgi:hypothetical protein
MFRRRFKDTNSYVGEDLVQPKGLYLAVCDESSGFNKPTCFADAWTAASAAGPDRLWAFNSFLVAEMLGERAIAWVLLLWGTFRLRVRVHSSMETMPFTAVCESLIGQLPETVVAFPSGRLGWVDVEAATWHSVCSIAPGRYLARLAGFENPNHWDVEPSEYARDDCDWVLHLLRLEHSSRTSHLTSPR